MTWLTDSDSAVYEWEFDTEQEVVIIKDGARIDEHGNFVLVRCPDGRYIRQANGFYRMEVSE